MRIHYLDGGVPSRPPAPGWPPMLPAIIAAFAEGTLIGYHVLDEPAYRKWGEGESR
jgi:hypothetical protein